MPQIIYGLYLIGLLGFFSLVLFSRNFSISFFCLIIEFMIFKPHTSHRLLDVIMLDAESCMFSFLRTTSDIPFASFFFFSFFQLAQFQASVFFTFGFLFYLSNWFCFCLLFDLIYFILLDVDFPFQELQIKSLGQVLFRQVHNFVPILIY